MSESPRFSRVPIEILEDRTLNHSDLRVYAILSLHAIRTNLVWVGQRRIAELASMNRRHVRRSLEKLARAGHISVSIHRITRRHVFQLNSPVFLEERANREIPRYPKPSPTLQ
ncbi:MAG: helix-turn-helix domain-containing protein [bacterium]|nr:helix-turn-helix domain-containing protein [bacterium]